MIFKKSIFKTHLSLKVLIGILSVAFLCACNMSYKMSKTEWTVPEVQEWSSANKKSSTWKGLLLYQGSDTIHHHFLGRIMDEWRWFNVKRNELSLEEIQPFNTSSSGQLGDYYVDPNQNFKRVVFEVP
jgi:hypothetical protein